MSAPPAGMAGPPGGPGMGPPAGGPPSPEQIAMYKEMGVRKLFASDIGAGFGPFIMGYVFNLIMLGILLAQVWHWYSWTKKEKNLIRIFVWTVLIFSAASSVFTVNWFIYLYIDNYGKYAQFVNNAWFSWIPIIDQPVILACHLFNLDRAWRINQKNKWVLILISPFILAATGVIIARKAVVGASDFNGAEIIKPYMYTFFACIVLVDVALTGSIAYGLWKSKTGWKHTDALIKRIIVYTVETQLLPSIAALSMAVQYAINSDTWMAFIYIIAHAKIPAVMMMAVLNYRLNLQHENASHKQMSTAGLEPSNGYISRTNSDHIPMFQYNDLRSESQLPLAVTEKGALKA